MSDSRTGYHDDAQGSGSKRAVRSTRTPINIDFSTTTPPRAPTGPKDNDPQVPHRSASVPNPAPSSGGGTAKRAMTTVPSPNIAKTRLNSRQRTASTNNEQSGSAGDGSVPPIPELIGPPSGNDFGMPKTSRDIAQDFPSSHLAPPRRSYKSASASDNARQSSSSFQTEPSSYYSFEDNNSSTGTPLMPQPPPRMPQPQHRDPINTGSDLSSDQDLSPQAQYEKLWNAAQVRANFPAPHMPVPDVVPPMPQPYFHESNEEDVADFRGKEGGSNVQMPEHPDIPSDRNDDDGWLAEPSSKMPSPGPPMPIPNHANSASSSGIASYSQGASHSTSLGSRPTIGTSSTAPPRVHHSRPTTYGQANASSTPSTGPTTSPVAPAIPTSVPPSHQAEFGRPNVQQSNANTTKHDGRLNENITSLSGIATNHASASSTTSPGKHSHGRPNYQAPNFGPQKPSNYEPRPPGASAPSFPSGAGSISQSYKPASVHPHSTQSTRPHTQTAPTHSAFSAPQPSGAKLEGRPSVSSTNASTSQSVKPPTSILLNSDRPSVPNVPQQQPPIRPSQTSGTNTATTVAPSQVSSYSTGPSKPNVTSNSPQTHNVLHGPTPTASHPQTHSSHPTKPTSNTISASQMQSSTSSHSKTEHEKPKPASTPAAATAALASGSTRPHLHGNPSQMDTQYVNMLLALDDIPAIHNLAAGFFNWILLAGFILFPGTFSSLQNLDTSGGGIPSQFQREIINTVTNLPLFIIAWICTALGAFGMVWLWWRWRKNYIWGLNKIFVPGFLNSLAGLVSTIASIFGVQHGELSKTSKITIIVTAVSTGVFGILAAFYSLWLVRRVKARHDREVGKERTGKYGEGVVDLSKRKRT